MNNLIHLAECAKIHGPLNKLSVFKYENHLQEIKKKIKKQDSHYIKYYPSLIAMPYHWAARFLFCSWRIILFSHCIKLSIQYNISSDLIVVCRLDVTFSPDFFEHSSPFRCYRIFIVTTCLLCVLII